MPECGQCGMFGETGAGMKKILIAVGFVAGMASSAVAQEAVPACAKADYDLPWADDAPAHRLFDLRPLVYVEGKTTPRDYSVNIDVVVDEGGRVTCSSPGSLDGIDTPQRKALFGQVGGWRYTPFLVGGKPARVLAREDVAEEVRPARHVAMPVAPLSRISIEYRISEWSVVMRGDGGATFSRIDMKTGRTVRQNYRIDEGEFAALVERFRAADAWSLAPEYVRMLPDNIGVSVLRIDVGGRVKTISTRNVDLAGMPIDMRRAIDEGLVVARFADHIPVPDEPAMPIPVQVPPVPNPSVTSE